MYKHVQYINNDNNLDCFLTQCSKCFHVPDDI